MAETLFIRLGSQAQEAIQWLVYSTAEQEIIASGELSHAQKLSELTEKAQQRQVKVIVPSSDVLLKSLTVPGKSSRAIKQAVPYMLEDDLAQDVEQLFFAFHDAGTDEQGHNCFTAIVERAQMQLWQSWLADAGIKAVSIVPEVLLMPIAEQGWSAIALAEHNLSPVVVRQGEWSGFTLDAITWQMQCQALANDEDAIAIDAYSALPCDDNLNLHVMPEELPLALMAKQSKKVSFNLLQGEFKVKSQHGVAIKNWLLVAGFAAFALLLTFAYKGAQLWQVNAQLAQVEQDIVDTYKKAFPKTKRVRVATIKSQLNQKLAQLGSTSDSEGFLALLAKVQPAFSKVPSLKPSSLKFDGKRQELRIQAMASSYQHFEQFQRALESTGLTVKQGAQNNQGQQVTGSFSIVNKAGSGQKRGRQGQVNLANKTRGDK